MHENLPNVKKRDTDGLVEEDRTLCSDLSFVGRLCGCEEKLINSYI